MRPLLVSMHAGDYSSADCIVNINIYESMDKMKCVAMNGFWQKLWPEGVNDFWGVHNQEAKINILVLAQCFRRTFHKSGGHWHPGILNAHGGELMKEDHVSDPEDKEGSDMWRDLSWLPILLRRPPDGGWCSHFFEADHFKDRCLELEHSTKWCCV